MGKKYILGIDIGSQTGFASVFEDGEVSCATAYIKNDFGVQLDTLYKNVRSFVDRDCKMVMIERPMGYAHSLMVMGGLFGVAVLACEHAGVPYKWVNLISLKKYATGNGRAKKEDMIEAARARFGKTLNEHEADAVHLAAYGWDNLAHYKP